ncbi:hypothetical protein BH20GEM1_BH20GEM1_03790 [soil metagenome]
MRVSWTLLAMTVLAAGPAFAQDPVVVDSAHYTLVFENEQVRVLRIEYGPGEESVMHDHPAGVAVSLEDSHTQFTLADGQVVESALKAGDAIWAPAGSHVPKSLSDKPSSLILVEIKDPPPGGAE